MGRPILQPWELEHQEQSQRPGAPHGSCPQVWAPAPAQAVTLSIWRAETSLRPSIVTRGPRGQVLGGDACFICLAGTVFPLLLRFAPSALDLRSYWLIFHLADVEMSSSVTPQHEGRRLSPGPASLGRVGSGQPPMRWPGVATRWPRGHGAVAVSRPCLPATWRARTREGTAIQCLSDI